GSSRDTMKNSAAVPSGAAEKDKRRAAESREVGTSSQKASRQFVSGDLSRFVADPQFSLAGSLHNFSFFLHTSKPFLLLTFSCLRRKKIDHSREGRPSGAVVFFCLARSSEESSTCFK